MAGLLHSHLNTNERMLVAEEIATRAVDALRLELQQQEVKKRNAPTSEKWYKLPESREFKLIRLVGYYSSIIEKEQEEAYREGKSRLDNGTMLIRFVKEIFSDGFSHNIFQLLVGTTRVLSDYPTKDAQRLHSVLVPDGEAGPDDCAYRRSKQRHMKTLLTRFPGFLRVEDVHGEDRFVKQENSSDSLPLVERCLNHFIPLKSRCITLPDKFNPTDDIVPEFLPRPAGNSPNDSSTPREKAYEAERHRMHSLTHPPCLSKLLERTNLPGFGERLEVPNFFPDGQPSDADSSPPQFDREDLPPLSEEQKKRMSFALRQLQERRARKLPDEVMVVVDGVERGVLNLNARSKLRMELESSDRMIEFTGRDAHGSLLLSVHLLQWDDDVPTNAKPEAHQLVLQDRRKIEFELRYLREDDELSGAVIDLSYSYRRALPMWPFITAGAVLLTAATTATVLIIKRSRESASLNKAQT